MQNVVGDSQGTGKAQNIISPPGGSGGGGGGGSFSTVTTTGLATLASLLVQNNLIGFGSFGVQLGFSRTVVSSAALLAGSNVQLVPAPGVGFIAIPLCALVHLDYAGTTYVSTGNPQAISMGASSAVLTMGSVLLEPANAVGSSGFIGNWQFTDSVVANQPIVTYGEGGASVIIGNSPITVDLLYAIIPTS